MSGLDGSGAVHAVFPREAFGGHVPSVGSEIYWFDQSIPIHLFEGGEEREAGAPLLYDLYAVSPTHALSLNHSLSLTHTHAHTHTWAVHLVTSRRAWGLRCEVKGCRV